MNILRTTRNMPDSFNTFSRKWKKLLTPWGLVILGVLFNILAALITNYFITVNNEKLAQLDERVEIIETRINNYWQDRQNIERKMEFILLLQQQDRLQSGKQRDPFVGQYIKGFMQQIRKQYNLAENKDDTLNSQKVIEIVQQTQEQIVNDIDEIYFDKLLLEKEKQVLAGINTRLMSIALFLQLLGLILILVKDFQRNR